MRISRRTRRWGVAGAISLAVAGVLARPATALAADAPQAAPAPLESEPPSALDPRAAFDAANAAFAEGRYDDAARGFRAILDQSGASAPLLYDLANAELRAGRGGEAVLGYERALALSPRDPDVAANLRQTRRAADLPEPQPGAWDRASAWLGVDEWAWLATAALWAACLLAALRGVRPGGSARRRGGLGLALLAGVTVTAWALALTRLAALDRAVVVGATPTLRVAPYDSATVSVELVPGQVVQIERGHEGFWLVRTEDGKAGWVAADNAERILPREEAAH